MYCVNCGAPIEEGKTLCDACQALEQEKAQAAVTEETAEQPAEVVEETPAKKGIRPWQLVLAFLAGGILLSVLVLGVLYGTGVSFEKPENDVFRKESYTVSDKELIRKKDRVVATIGTEELTVSQLQAYYWLGFSDQFNQNAYTFIGYGMVYTDPLDAQYLPDDSGMSWQMYFLENALNVWKVNTQLALEAKETGFTLEQNMLDSIANMPENLEKMAIETGYESAADMLSKELGACCTEQDYIGYLENMLLAESYYGSQYEALYPTDEQVTAYFTQNEAALTQQGITRELGNLVNVRHILLQPDEVMKDEEGNEMKTEEGYPVYTEESWAACLEKTDALLKEWLDNNPTEESFAQLANLHSVDGGSNTNGGLYTNVQQGQMVEAFDAWIMDDARQTGDYGVVQTPYGYHIMYFVSGEPYWMAAARQSLLQESLNSYMASLNEKWPMEVEYKKIVLGTSAITQLPEETTATDPTATDPAETQSAE